ncbi:MAG: HEAT repeat domain-containing protein [Spirochaetales bacterium]|nr:HEAT repeat domain-containing protein [Spirochaetales bacterium]
MPFLKTVGRMMKTFFYLVKDSLSLLNEKNDRPSHTAERAGNHTFDISSFIYEYKNFVRISLAAGNLLPPPLEISHPGSSRLGLRFDEDDFARINASAGREVIDGGVARAWRTLRRRCRSFSIHETGIETVLTARTDGLTNAREDVKKAMALLATRLSEIGRAADLKFLYFVSKVRFSGDPYERKTSLKLLLKHYGPENPAVAELLRRAAAQGDFDIGYLSVEALGGDADRYAFLKAETAALPDRIAAVKKIARKRINGGSSFLVGLYSAAAEEELRREIVIALGELADGRAEGLLLEALAVGNGELKSAALTALASCGGRRSVRPLFYLKDERRLSPETRASAESALSAIRARLGEEDAGRLSLAGGETAEGGLSRAEDHSAGDGASSSPEKH